MSKPRKSDTDVLTIRRDIARSLLGFARDYNGLIGGLALLGADFRGKPLTFYDLAAMPPATLRGLADTVQDRMRAYGNSPWEVTALHLLAGDTITLSTLQLPRDVALGFPPGPAWRVCITADDITEAV